MDIVLRPALCLSLISSCNRQDEEEVASGKLGRGEKGKRRMRREGRLEMQAVNPNGRVNVLTKKKRPFLRQCSMETKEKKVLRERCIVVACATNLFSFSFYLFGC